MLHALLPWVHGEPQCPAESIPSLQGLQQGPACEALLPRRETGERWAVEEVLEHGAVFSLVQMRSSSSGVAGGSDLAFAV